MTARAAQSAVRHAASAVRRRLRARIAAGRRAGENGFILLESMIAISVITVVMSAVGAEFVGGMVASAQGRAQQGAVQVADSAVEQIRSLHGSDLLTGRDPASVDAQFSAAPTRVAPWLASMDEATDASATSGAGSAAVVPTTGSTVTPGTVAYTVNRYLGWCSVPTAGSGSKACVATSTLQGSAATQYVRAVVAVTWSGQRCDSSLCVYVTSTLISTATDHTFRVTAPAYATPVVVAPADQVSVVGDTVSLQLAVKNGTGVPQFTWTLTRGSLPSGLSLGTTGLISGTVQAPPGSYSATVQVTDAFIRSDSQVVTWTVKPPLALTDPGPQAALVGQATSLTLSATGGAGAPYTYAILNASLPKGLTLATATGVVSGKPTTPGTYIVTVQVTDASTTRKATGQFAWTVAYPPIAASNPSQQVDTLGTAIKPLTLTASGGSGRYLWTDPTGSLPAGLSVSSAGVVSGTPTALTGGASVTLTVSDASLTVSSTTVTFTWAVVAKPTVTAPASPLTLTVGQVVSLPLSSSCPNSPCRYTLDNGPGGLSIDATGLLKGTVAGPAATYGNVTVTATDVRGATGRSSEFVVVVRAAPTVAGTAQSGTVGGSVSVALNPTCPNAPCSYRLNKGPAGLSIDGTGLITGILTGAATYSAVTVIATDANGVVTTSSPFTWVVYAPPTLAGLAATAIGENATPSVAVRYTCPAIPCTIALSGTLASPSIGLGLSAAPVTTTANSARSLSVGSASGTVYVTGLVSTGLTDPTRTYGVSLTITDTNGIGPAASTATWTVYRTPTISTPGQVTTSQSDTPSQALTYSCPTTTCTIAVTGLPAGIGLSTSSNTAPTTVVRGTYAGGVNATVYLNGKVSDTAAKATYAVTVTITSGSTTISSSGLWTVQ